MGMVLASAAHGKAVNKACPAGFSPKGGFKNQGPVQVAANDIMGNCRCDFAEAALFPIENSAEAAAGIHARHAAPVDGAASADKCRRVAICDETVV